MKNFSALRNWPRRLAKRNKILAADCSNCSGALRIYSGKSEKIVKLKYFELFRSYRVLACDDAPILNVLSSKTFLTVHNVKLFIGVIERRINLIISTINIEDSSNRILARKDRVPKFNIRESAKMKH